jgi:carbamoyl-phosphate synthase small subunit
MLSNGPGDPADNELVIKELHELCESGMPIFGICLGHQLLALSQGGQTAKLKYGHRGANQPVKDLTTGRVYITSQNHGYAVKIGSLPDNAHLKFLNANDGTCKGIEYDNMPVFSVQFHPEAAAGPLDTGFLFDRFMDLMGGVN